MLPRDSVDSLAWQLVVTTRAQGSHVFRPQDNASGTKIGRSLTLIVMKDLRVMYSPVKTVQNETTVTLIRTNYVQMVRK